MTCRVFNDRLHGIHVNTVQYRLLIELARRSEFRCRSVTLPKGTCCKLCNRSASTVARSFAGLSAQGLVSVMPRYGKNGAQLENSYRLTKRGLNILHLICAAAYGNRNAAASRPASLDMPLELDSDADLYPDFDPEPAAASDAIPGNGAIRATGPRPFSTVPARALVSHPAA